MIYLNKCRCHISLWWNPSTIMLSVQTCSISLQWHSLMRKRDSDYRFTDFFIVPLLRCRLNRITQLAEIFSQKSWVLLWRIKTRTRNKIYPNLKEPFMEYEFCLFVVPLCTKESFSLDSGMVLAARLILLSSEWHLLNSFLMCFYIVLQLTCTLSRAQWRTWHQKCVKRMTTLLKQTSGLWELPSTNWQHSNCQWV